MNDEIKNALKTKFLNEPNKNIIQQDPILDLKNFIKLLDEQIKKHHKIAIFFHIKPDGDAYGSAFGLKRLIELNYQNKEVIVVVIEVLDDVNLIDADTKTKFDNAIKINKKANKNKKGYFFPTSYKELLDIKINNNLERNDQLPNFYDPFKYYEEIKDKYRSYSNFFDLNKENALDDVLGILVDNNTYSRINGPLYWDVCNTKLVIDHHTNPVLYLQNAIYYTEPLNSATEVLTKIMLCADYKYDEIVCKNFYLGLLTDSNRFFYDKLNADTFLLASILIKKANGTSFVPYDMHLKLAETSLSLRQTQTWLFDTRKEIEINPNFKILYNIIDKQDVSLLDKNASSQVNVFANLQDVEVWCLVIYDSLLNKYKISCRSKHYSIVEVCKQFNGGGHNLACSCTIDDLKDVPYFFEIMTKHLKDKINEDKEIKDEEGNNYGQIKQHKRTR